MPTFALNFSRPGAEVIAQYYTFFRLGFDGYTAVQQASRDVATSLAQQIEQLGPYRLITRGDQLPVFAFTTTDNVTEWDVFAVSRGLREHGWQVPAYTFPADRTDLAVLRIVCRNGFSRDLADLFLHDLTPGHRHPASRRREGRPQRPDLLPPLNPPQRRRVTRPESSSTVTRVIASGPPSRFPQAAVLRWPILVRGGAAFGDQITSCTPRP